MNFIEFISIVIGVIGIEYSAGQLWSVERKLLHKRSLLLLMFWLGVLLIITTIAENTLS